MDTLRNEITRARYPKFTDEDWVLINSNYGEKDAAMIEALGAHYESKTKIQTKDLTLPIFSPNTPTSLKASSTVSTSEFTKST